jgi:hypothetical protein
MTRFLRNLLIAAFLLCFVLLLGFFNATKPRILVLHSGAQGSAWVDAVDRGMRTALERNRRPVSVEWDYLGVAAPAAARNTDAAVAQARRAGYVAIAIVASSGVALAAYYALRMYQRTMHNPLPDGADDREISLRDGLIVVPMLLVVVILAFAPQIVLSDTAVAVEQAVAAFTEVTR